MEGCAERTSGHHRATKGDNYTDNDTDSTVGEHINGHDQDSHAYSTGKPKDYAVHSLDSTEDSIGARNDKRESLNSLTNSENSYERHKPKLNGHSWDATNATHRVNHVYVSPRISLRSKHVIRDIRDEEPLPTAKRTRLEVIE